LIWISLARKICVGSFGGVLPNDEFRATRKERLEKRSSADERLSSRVAENGDLGADIGDWS
jgi:hypothetical protein